MCGGLGGFPVCNKTLTTNDYTHSQDQLLTTMCMRFINSDLKEVQIMAAVEFNLLDFRIWDIWRLHLWMCDFGNNEFGNHHVQSRIANIDVCYCAPATA